MTVDCPDCGSPTHLVRDCHLVPMCAVYECDVCGKTLHVEVEG